VIVIYVAHSLDLLEDYQNLTSQYRGFHDHIFIFETFYKMLYI